MGLYYKYYARYLMENENNVGPIFLNEKCSISDDTEPIKINPKQLSLLGFISIQYDFTKWLIPTR